MKLDISDYLVSRVSTTICLLEFINIGVYLVSRGLLKLWKITAIISETVQDRDIVAMEDQ